MIGVFVNVASVLLGSLVGLLFRKGIPERISRAMMLAIGLCTLYIGIDGALEGSNAIVLSLSMAFGTLIGTLLDIDGKINSVGLFIERKMKKEGEKTSIAEGFMTASLLFCVGAMTIVGSLNAGLTGDNTLIYTKSILDLISSCLLASTLGIGVMFSALFILVVQGTLVLLAGLLQNVLTNEALIAELTCAGSVMIIGMSFNMLGITRLKVANFLPALLLVPLFYKLIQLLPI